MLILPLLRQVGRTRVSTFSVLAEGRSGRERGGGGNHTTGQHRRQWSPRRGRSGGSSCFGRGNNSSGGSTRGCYCTAVGGALVGALVQLQVVAACKAAVACITAERFLSCVLAFVPGELVRSRELPCAFGKITHVWLFTLIGLKRKKYTFTLNPLPSSTQ